MATRRSREDGAVASTMMLPAARPARRRLNSTPNRLLVCGSILFVMMLLTTYDKRCAGYSQTFLNDHFF